MKRPRPYIPLSVRVAVAERQYFGEPMGDPRDGGQRKWLAFLVDQLSMNITLATIADGRLLQDNFEKRPMQLDHDPALILRKFSEKTGKYTPDANDPDYLVYRPKDNHGEKTTGRKPGALKTITTKGSDIWLKTKFAKLEKRTKKSRRPKQRIPSRGFPKTKRKFGQ